jgi:alkane 1-monooxygenase
MSRKFTYFFAFSLPLVTALSIYLGGWWSYGTVLEAFILIPGLELMTSPRAQSPTEEEERLMLSDRFYDLLLYAMVPFQFLVLFYFLSNIGSADLMGYERTGMILSMGIQCGAIGINVAHELGHRSSKTERFLARALLMTSLYMHFIVEHNHGHHRHVATPRDPASARLNEPIYLFWFRTLIGSFRSAWRIEKGLQQKNGRSVWTIHNAMIQLLLLQGSFIFLIYLIFGAQAVQAFLLAAFIGMLLLETVNYIEHYGLSRKETSPGKYERVQPWHSWNSDYPIGRIVLFELTRHSDHHYKASKKYQVLRHLDESPQLPTGYPGMMLLSLIPPIWFRVVNPRIPALSRS